ncbi:ABC transporter substrate-binding protein [Azotobacter chroococcum]|nr:ABC transporter substrate-binding protein [Azotobacter chroococcum]
MSQHSGGLSRRRFLAGSAGALALAPLLGHGLRAEAATPGRLRVAQYKGGDKLLLEAAGLADTPYPIDWAEFASGNLMVEAMNGGSLDLAYGSEIPPLFGFIKGARIRVVGVIRGDVNEQTVLVPKDSPIQSIADLKGKRVGYVRATTTQYYLTKMLAEVGLSFADIEAINLTVPDGAAAFRTGQLDAWAIYGYSVPLAQTSVGARVLKRANGYLSGNYLFFASPEAIADPQRHAAIADFFARLQKAFAWRQANPERYAAALAAEIGVPVEAVLALLRNESQVRRLVPVDDAAIHSQQDVADTFLKAGVIERPVDVRPLWDGSFAAALAS